MRGCGRVGEFIESERPKDSASSREIPNDPGCLGSHIAEPRKVRTLFVTGLPYDIKHRELHLLFHTFKPQSCLGLHTLHPGSSVHTRTPHVRLWAELRDHCQVPHHGASLSPKLRYQKNCDLSSLPPWLQRSLCHTSGFICV